MRLRLRQPMPAVGTFLASRIWARNKMAAFFIPPNTVYDSGRDRATAALRRRAEMLTMAEVPMTSGVVLGKPALQLHPPQPVPE